MGIIDSNMSNLCKEVVKDSEIEEQIKEFSTAINTHESQSLKTKLVAVYKNQIARDDILEKGYNEEFYALEYGYNQQYINLNNDIQNIITEGTPIPNYWNVVVDNSKFFPLNDKDKEILKHLTNITLKYDEVDKKSFTVFFHFSDNEFFEPNVLSKTYNFKKKDDAYTNCKSTEIKWKGDAPNVKIVKKKIKKGKNISTVTKEKKVDSFFNIFEDKDEEDEDDKEEEDENMEEDAGLSSEADFVQNDLIPFSMEYYLDLQKLSALNDGGDDDEEDEEEDKPKRKK